jgi:aldehyde:ferredoxin oxidoreductase
MKMSGYAGTVVKVDLTRKTVATEPLDRDFAKKFIGPEGISFRWFYDLVSPKMDSFSENSPIIIGAGPVVGTPVPASSRVCAAFKHPCYRGLIENSHAGGDFGPMLKWAGYDYLVITGKSETPVYLNIDDEEVSICDAADIWGKDLYESTDWLWGKHDNASVLAIGPAGEKLVRTTVCLIDKVHTLGKGGLPAVMGSKKLKAVVANGRRGLKVADAKRLKKAVMPVVERMRSHPNLKTLIDLGSMAGFGNWFQRQGGSMKNWTSTFPVDEAFRLYGTEVYKKDIRKDRIACFGCPAGCKDHVRVRQGEFAGLETYGSSLYGRLENFAARCNVGSFNRFCECLDYCQRMSLCIHEITAIIDWAIDLYKHGIIKKADTGGVELDWDFQTTMKLLEQVARNEGLGAVLGKGMLGAMEEIGGESEKLAIHIKGGSPLYDARVNRMNIAEFGQVINPKGAHPGRTPIPALYMARDLADGDKVAKEWAKRNGMPADAMGRIFSKPGRYNIGRLTKWSQERRMVFNSLGIGCSRERGGISYGTEEAIEIYSAVTGFELTVGELQGVGARSVNLLKALNLREGFTRKDDRFPDRWFEPVLRHGEVTQLEDFFGERLTKDDCERMLDEYYEESGWDVKLGAPGKKKLMMVGLGDIAEDLERSGLLPE